MAPTIGRRVIGTRRTPGDLARVLTYSKLSHCRRSTRSGPRVAAHILLMVTPSTTARLPKLFIDILARFLDGQPSREVVHRTAGY